LGHGLACVHFQLDNVLSALTGHIGTALEKQHPEYLFLELGGIHLATQYVGGSEQVAL
jgi:hypothetical protein